MGKAAVKERVKLTATYLNNLAVAIMVTGLIAPYITIIFALIKERDRVTEAAQQLGFDVLHKGFGLIFESKIYTRGILILFFGSMLVSFALHLCALRTLNRLKD